MTASPRVYGLTGGIAAGKSTAARYFARQGIPVVDADEIARSLRQPGGAAHAAILAKFGTDDRQVLRDRVFADPQAKADLESILHPLIRAESLKSIRALLAPIVIYEAALLVETGRARDFSGLILVECEREERIRRLMGRDGTTTEKAQAILDSQGDDRAKRAAADFVIDNSGSLAELQTRVESLARELKGSG